MEEGCLLLLMGQVTWCHGAYAYVTKLDFLIMSHSYSDDRYQDPELLQAGIWDGVFTRLTQLQKLSLTTNDVTQRMWADLAVLSGLRSLNVHHTAWSLNYDIECSPFKLSNLQVNTVVGSINDFL